ncbi:necrosis inducing protein [Colletotrichum graminicola]|uniref:Necrosis inducing protein n=1 Tax=Colletotrichum graminicola (strain M1.001 / M2 / FGSC 10212) TaxID=645133 RepID=E3R011_COLGM|nr:necrosis inducing protein [Colletotrichum graminicola M1.001]EFQ36455.1 necrosis inducing protein [Colletotrichum graminicola M1.001]WDK19154.1 necrosis inducing protein [Colletotrichum graminicola]
MFVGKLLPFIGLLRAASGTPVDRLLDRRDVVGHDTLNPLPQRVQDNYSGAAIARFNPLLHIASGCQPYTAVDDAGNISGGLKPSGKSDGGCRDTSKGQTYARIGQYNQRWAIMYAWYWPKDQPLDGVSTGAHRHDWENVVIFINDPSDANPTILGGGASGHGQYKESDFLPRQGDSVKVEYFAEFPTNHELQFTSTVGRTYPVLDWDVMTPAMQNALNNADFGSADVPFKDANFISSLGNAANF